MEHEEKGPHGDSSLNRTQKQVGAQRQGPIEEPLVLRTGRTLHDARIRLLDAETECRERVGTHVDRENLNWRECQRNAEQGKGEIGD